MFYVVQLDSDIFKEKLVVPSIWLDKYNTFCLLPPMTNVAEIETLAKAQSTPKHGWQLHSVSFIKSFVTYSQAKEDITKGKTVMIKLEEEEEEQHHKKVRRKRKRKLPGFLEQYSIKSDDDDEEGCSSTQEGCSMEDSIVLKSLIVKIERMEDSIVTEGHHQPRLNATHNKSSSSLHSSLQHDRQLQVARSRSSTMRRMNFAIVKFITEDDYVSIISSNWITDDRNTCRYPNSPNVERLLKKRIKPTPDWKTYPVEIVKEYQTFSEAQEHIAKAEDSSNLDSEPDECSTMSPSISSVSSIVPSIASISSSFHPIESSTVSSQLSHASSYPIASRTSETVEVDNLGDSETEQNDSSDPFAKRVFSLLLDVQGHLKELKSDVKENSKKFDRLDEKINSLQGIPPSPNPIIYQKEAAEYNFPISSMEQLLELEQQLLEDKNANKLCLHLSIRPASSMKQMVLSIMKYLLTRSVALEFNLNGLKDKKKFASLHICNIIIGAVQIIYKEETAAEIMKRISLVLAGARDWDGERKKRLSNNIVT